LVYEDRADQVFEAPNGEGTIVIPAKREMFYEERWCSDCNDWRGITGLIAYFQARYVGCDKCGRPYCASV